MALSVTFHNYGTSSSAPALTPAVAFTVRQYSKRAVGGAFEADFEARGSVGALIALMGYLHYGIRVTNEQGEVCWDGEITSVTVNTRRNDPYAAITAKGWWHTLGRRMYAHANGLTAFYNATGERHNFSEGTNITHVAQSFHLQSTASDYDVYSVGINLYMVGSRTDDVLVEIRTDSGGSPSATTVTSGVIPYGAIASSQGYCEVELGAPFTLTSSTSWIVVSCYGSPSASAFYQVGVNATDAYADGLFKWYTPSAWTAGRADTGKACDMQFKLIGQVETTTQISNAITTYNDNFTGIDILDRSNIVTCQYRQEERSLQDVVEELLATGTTNGKRLLAKVSPERRITIYEEPSSTGPWQLAGPIELGVNLDTVTNSVKVIYTTQNGASNASGAYAESGYQTDSVSIARYGTFETIEQANDTTLTAVTQQAAATLAQKKNPIAEISFSGDAPIDIRGVTSAPVRRDTCPVGYWARIAATGMATPESALAGSSTLVFIEEAEYVPERDEYIPRPRGAPDRMSVQVVDG